MKVMMFVVITYEINTYNVIEFIIRLYDLTIYLTELNYYLLKEVDDEEEDGYN